MRDDTLYFLEESCLNCTVGTMCESYLDTPEAKVDDIARSVPTKKKNDDGSQGDNNQAENIAVDEEDEGNTDNESDDESDADECADECLNIGIVWKVMVSSGCSSIGRCSQKHLSIFRMQS